MKGRDSRRVSQGIGFKSCDGGAIDNVLSGFFYFFLYVGATVEDFVMDLNFAIGRYAQARQACFHGFKVFLSFGSPTLIFNRVPVGVVSVIRYRRVGSLFRVEGQGVVTTRICRRAAVARAEVIVGDSRQSNDKCLFIFNRQRDLMRHLCSVGCSQLASSVRVSIFEDCLRLVPLFINGKAIGHRGSKILPYNFDYYPSDGSHYLFGVKDWGFYHPLRLFVTFQVGGANLQVGGGEINLGILACFLKLQGSVRVSGFYFYEKAYKRPRCRPRSRSYPLRRLFFRDKGFVVTETGVRGPALSTDVPWPGLTFFRRYFSSCGRDCNDGRRRGTRGGTQYRLLSGGRCSRRWDYGELRDARGDDKNKAGMICNLYRNRRQGGDEGGDR